MALNRWSLDRLCMIVGAASLLTLFVPTAIYLTHSISASVEDSLLQRAETLGQSLAIQLVEPLLLDDRTTLRDRLDKSLAAQDEVVYLGLCSERGEITSHTFQHGYPLALAAMWNSPGDSVRRFKSGKESLMDVAVPVKDGRLGYIHVGIAREQALQAGQRHAWTIGILFTLALWMLLMGTGLLAARVCAPLQQLAEAVSQLPDGNRLPAVHGTREVEALARGFEQLSNRLQTLAGEQAANQERMIHAERLATLGELAAGLAHEIHNPLDGMLECLRYLDGDPGKSERADKYYPMLRDGLERIARTMRQMLTFARSAQPVPCQPAPAGQLVAELELMLKPRLQDHNVKLSWHGAGSCVCLCNRDSLMQAGLNLILNAVDAAEGNPQSQVVVKLSCDNTWVYFTVDDNGPGVPEAMRGRIFDAFFTTRPLGKGTGLGLSVSRQITRATGGDVELADRPSPLGGARFIIKLPRSLGKEVQHATEGKNTHCR